MDRLQRYVEEAMGLIQEASSDPEHPSVEIRNGLGGSSPYELDGEELVSLIALVLTDGLHHGLSAWDVLEQIDRLPETAQVCLAPSTAATSGRSLHAVPGDVDDLMSIPELETYMSFISRDRSAIQNAGDDGAASVTTRRAMHGLSTKFLRNIASMAKKFSPSAPAPVRAKVFLRCALNMRSLTAAIEALASQPMIGKTFYGPNGLFRSPLAVKTLLTIIAPIGGPNLRVRAAASLFDVGQDVLVKPGLDYDGLSALIQSSGATRAAENASRSTTATSETADAVALLCSTVAEARDTLRQYPVAAAYLSVATVRFKLELTLKSDQQLHGAAASPGGPGSDPYGGARRRGASVMVPGGGGGGGEADNTLAAADETSSSNPIVVQRRRRAGTVRAANGAPIPAAKRSVKRKPGTGSEVTSPAAAGERVSSPQALSPQHSGDVIGVDAPSIGEPAVHPSGPFPPRGGRSDSASGSQSYTQQPPSRPQQPPQATRRSQSPAALQPSPSTSGVLATNPSTTFNASLGSTLRGGKSASPVMAAPRATTLSEHLATTNIRELVSFTDDELAAMDAAKARALELDARVAKLKEFVQRRDERMSQHSANVEPLLAAYEESVARMFEAALVRMAGKERELMAFHDYDAPPPPPEDDEEDDEPSIVAPPVSRTHVYGKLSSH